AVDHARGFTGGRTDPPGNCREVVGRREPAHGEVELALVDQVVPFGDEIAERTALMTERNAAVHAPRSLRAHFGGLSMDHELTPVLHALFDGALVFLDARHLQKTSRIAHGSGSRL